MSIFNLSDSTKDRQVTFTIPKKVDSYFAAYYQKRKKDEETPEAFLLRIIGAIVAADHAQTKVTIDKQAFDNGIEIAGNDLSTFLIENGLNE